MRLDVSVVMSVYNGDRYLRSSIESVLAQEGVSFEFIAVDDGSTDDSPRILAELEARDPRLRVIKQENTGLTQALIRGCAEARGEFIARHDADDVSLPGRLARQVARLRRSTEVVFVSCWAQAIGPEDEILLEPRPPPDVAQATRLLLRGGQGPCAHGTVMMRTEAYQAVGGYRWQFYYGQDSDLWLRLGERGGFAFVPETLYHYRVTPSSISYGRRSVQAVYGRLGHQCKRARQAGEDEAPFLAGAAAIAGPNRRPKCRMDSVGGNYFIGSCLKARGDTRGNNYLWLAIWERPWYLRAWARLFLGLGEVSDCRH